MRSIDELQKMFDEIGLGTEEERNKLLVLQGTEEIKEPVKKYHFIRLDSRSQSIRGDHNA